MMSALILKSKGLKVNSKGLPRLAYFCCSSWTDDGSSSDNNKVNRKLPNVQLYRILRRKCLELERTLESYSRDEMLLQPPLNPHRAGASRVIKSLHDAQVPAVLRLFRTWAESDEEHAAVASDNKGTNPTSQGDFLDSWFKHLFPNRFEEEGEAWHRESCDSLWTSPHTLREALRYAFRYSQSPDSVDNVQSQNQLYLKWAIRAYKYLAEQQEMQRLTSTSCEHDVRVTATSRCIGRSLKSNNARSSRSPSSSTQMHSYRFVYRIRIENLSARETIQLLGRTWNIFQHSSVPDSPRDDEGKPKSEDPSIRVHSPHGGAVGKHPVLQPDEAFEYMSGCDLDTPHGTMQGCFHFSRVPSDTQSAAVGQPVSATDRNEKTQEGGREFEVVVQPFALREDVMRLRY